MPFFHVREELLNPGDKIASGRWGATVRSQGNIHPHFVREEMLEAIRIGSYQSTCPVSRYECSYVFDDLASAQTFATPAEWIYEVDLVNPDAQSSRHDLLWLTLINKPGLTPAQIEEKLHFYWRGVSTLDHFPNAHPMWERLVGSDLVVLSQFDIDSII